MWSLFVSVGLPLLYAGAGSVVGAAATAAVVYVRSGQPPLVDLSDRPGLQAVQTASRKVLARIDPSDGVSPREFLDAVRAELGL